MIAVSTSTWRGSIYVRSANSGSVMIVAGLELARISRNPSWRRTLHACVPEESNSHPWPMTISAVPISRLECMSSRLGTDHQLLEAGDEVVRVGRIGTGFGV